MTSVAEQPAREESATARPKDSLLQSILHFEITKKKVKRRELMHFSRQMAVFVRAGVPVLEALETITDEVDDKLFKRALNDIHERLRSGATIADAAEAHPEVFSDLHVSILRTAEYTGHLDDALERISQYIERDLEAQRKIKEALFYPIVVLALSIVVVIVLTVWVIPKFETF